MMRKRVLHSLIGMLVLVATAQTAQAMDLPAEAFILLAQASVEPCAICAEKERGKAVALLSRTFTPGQELTTDSACRLIKSGSGDEQELTVSCYPPPSVLESLPEGAKPPRLVFRFHTSDKHLVGIAANDFTDPPLAATYRSSPPGTTFEGRLRFIAYQYGDGPSFNCFLKTNTVQVHCVIVQLNTANPLGADMESSRPDPDCCDPENVSIKGYR